MKNNAEILIVDDEEDTLTLLQTHLRNNGWSVDAASHPLTALKMLKHKEYFLMITDIAMPGLDGYELIEEVSVQFPKMQVAVMTCFGYNPDHSLLVLHKQYKCPVFLKPFNLEDSFIIDTIANIWEQSQTTS